MSDLLLGKTQDYPETYSPEILFAIPRKENRAALGIDDKALPFSGEDIWNAYELSWLNAKAKPCVGLLVLRVPCDSKCIVESKSLKLYFNSLNFTKVASLEALEQMIAKDIEACIGSGVSVEISEITAQLDRLNAFNVVEAQDYNCIDDADITFDSQLDIASAKHLKLITNEQDQSKQTNTRWVSHLFRSQCPVTGQPDWASIFIDYTGPELCETSLLKFILSFRRHQGFHEDCVERIYTAINELAQPEALTVYGRFTRRGGIDINPVRSNRGKQGQPQSEKAPNSRLVRQ